MRCLILLLIACLTALAAGPKPPVYVMLWFDTEDYLLPEADDAALRIAQDLEQRGVRATFKLVGEKARVLQKRGRQDVIRALLRHDIGYHSNFHSVQPTPALYLNEMGWLEGAAEFERRERSGVEDIHRIFGVTPSCYGQPGSSWGPQSFPALRRMGIHVYLDEATQVGVDEQPFWFGGLFNIFHMGRYSLRPNLDDEAGLPDTLRRFDQDVETLRARGGGVISTYFHPTEFIAAKFWDAVNFTHGANPERSEWRLPPLRTHEDSEKRFHIMLQYVDHAKASGVQFITARETPQLYRSPDADAADRARIAAHMQVRQTFLVTERTSLSAADMLLALLGMPWRYVDGPSEPGRTTYAASEIPRAVFEGVKSDAVSFIQFNRRLPAQVWAGSQTLEIADFAATLAGDDGSSGAVLRRQANPEMQKYIATDPAKPFNWVIHPEGFRAARVLDLARLQAWTLKPAILR